MSFNLCEEDEEGKEEDCAFPGVGCGGCCCDDDAIVSAGQEWSRPDCKDFCLWMS